MQVSRKNIPGEGTARQRMKGRTLLSKPEERPRRPVWLGQGEQGGGWVQGQRSKRTAGRQGQRSKSPGGLGLVGTV